MKKVLEVCLSPDLGGLELYMKNITKYLNSNAVINKKSKLKNVFENEKMDCKACEISHCTPFSGGRVGVYLIAKAE